MSYKSYCCKLSPIELIFLILNAHKTDSYCKFIAATTMCDFESSNKPITILNVDHTKSTGTSTEFEKQTKKLYYFLVDFPNLHMSIRSMTDCIISIASAFACEYLCRYFLSLCYKEGFNMR